MKINRSEFNKISFFLLLVILLSLSTYMFFSKKEKKIDMDVGESEAKIFVDNLSFLRPYEILSEGYGLLPDIMIKDEDGQNLSFRNLLYNENEILIYRFSETHCDLCIVQHLQILKELSSRINLNKIVLLGAYTNTKKIKILRQTYNLNFRIFNILDDIGIPLEKVNNPYFFILDKNMKCRCFFAAIKENPQLTVSCLETVANNLNHSMSINNNIK